MTWHETYREAYRHRFTGCVFRRCDGGWLVLDAFENAVLFGSEEKNKEVHIHEV